MTIDDLHNSIMSNVNTDLPVRDYFSVTEFKDLVYKLSVKIKFTDEFEKISVKVWSKAIQAAIDTYKNVYIPKLDHDIYLDSPIVMKSGCHLEIDPNQRIHLLPDTNTCLIKNEHTLSEPHDFDISVRGGIWSTLSFADANGNSAGRLEKGHPMLGARGVMIFCNIENFNNGKLLCENLNNCK